jgi:phosphate ABC transporter, permease protein PstA
MNLMRRKSEELFFRVLMFLATCLIALVLFVILYGIFHKGISSLSWEMLTSTPRGGFYFGKEGGIANAIIGSIYLSFGAVLLALIIGVPVALFMNIYLLKFKKIVNTIRFFLDILWGIPSIVYGAFGFSVMILFGWKTSLLAGIIIVALFIIPILIRGIDEVLKTVPMGLLESSFSLGATKSEIAFRVIVRQCFPGIVTSILLSFGRAIGDAAAVLFTTGFTDRIPTSLSQPTATLPLSIFFQLSSPVAEVKNRAYAAAAVLTIIILVISIFSRYISDKYKRNRIG